MVHAAHDVKHMRILVGGIFSQIRQVHDIFGRLPCEAHRSGIWYIMKLFNGGVYPGNSFRGYGAPAV